MNASGRRKFLSLAGVMTSAFAGCTAMQPIHSQPPLTKVVLPLPATTQAWLSRLSLPAGVYRPLYEDGDMYYYQAPSRVIVGTLDSRLFDGGVYARGGTKVLRGWWFIDEEGSLNQGRFHGAPPAFIEDRSR